MSDLLEVLKILGAAVGIFLAYRYTAGRADAAAARQAELEAERSRVEADRVHLWQAEAEDIVTTNDQDKAKKFMDDSFGGVPVDGSPKPGALPGAGLADKAKD